MKSIHILTLLAGFSLVPSVLPAQQPSAADVIADFAANTALREYPSPDYPAGHWVARTVVRPQQYPAARVDSILDGLQSLVLNSSSSGTRLASVYWLSVAGSSGSASPVDGVVRRLDEVYRRSESRQIRVAVANTLLSQNDAAAAVRVMEYIASEDRPEEHGSEAPAAYAAVQGLLHMGSEGVAALRRLHAVDAVRNPFARSRLDRIAEDGFRN